MPECYGFKNKVYNCKSCYHLQHNTFFLKVTDKRLAVELIQRCWLLICKRQKKRHIYINICFSREDVEITLSVSLFVCAAVQGWKGGEGRSGRVERERGKILIKQGLCIDSALCIRQKVKQMPGQRCHFKQWLLALESALCLLRKHSPFRLLIASRHGVCLCMGVCVCGRGSGAWWWWCRWGEGGGSFHFNLWLN